MEKRVKNNELAVKIGELLSEHKCSNTIVIDIGDTCSWTDFFIITTVRSSAHTQGLLRYLYGFIKDNNMSQLNHRKNTKETGWILLDCGDIVIHLMEEEQRLFYEIERLWFKGTVLYTEK